MGHPADNLAQTLSQELSLPLSGVDATLQLLDGGATIPFIARYRKEATGDLDETQIRAVQERHAYLRELEDRRQTVLKSIEEQGKLTPELRLAILSASAKTTLEDLYLPYRPKRRTRATIARDRGLEPLAQRIMAQANDGKPEEEARAFVDEEKGVGDPALALQGARDIVAETIAETAAVRSFLRQRFAETGVISARATKAAAAKRTKYEQYYDFEEPVATIPSHRFLAIRRGEREEALRVTITVDEERALERTLSLAGHRPSSPFAGQLVQAASDALKRLLMPSVETDTRAELKERSDRAAIDIFADNLRALLLAPPAGDRPVIGVDPGLRTGCKCAAVDATGAIKANTTLYLVGRDENRARAAAELVALVSAHRPFAVAVGNGTGGREAESFARQTLAEAEQKDVIVVPVNESGASVYSASELAREEFPDLDITVRGAISIARRLQDPLAELVKVEPKAIGVGQYQHDVDQPLLARKLDEVVESCVNAVGVELNTASAPLLARVAGVGPKLAKKIVAHRETSGSFRTRKALLKVAGLGPRTFEQAAGFLRIRGGDHPLDATAVHPERYALVERLAGDLELTLQALIGDREQIASIDLRRYVDESVGELTLRDIKAELQKPGRDPRAAFEPPSFRDDVHELEDLTTGMVLEGVVTNVTAFGAFVDVGVHQDGLVHVSQLADRFVRDPREVVTAGDRLQVRVLDVDLERRRISLSARKDEAPKRTGERGPHTEGRDRRPRAQGRDQSSRQQAQATGDRGRQKRGRQDQTSATSGFSNNPFADALKGR